MQRILCVCSVLTAGFIVFSGGPTTAAEQFDPQRRAAAIWPFLDDQAIIVAHVDMSGIEFDAMVKAFRDFAMLPETLRAEMDQARKRFFSLKAAFKKAGAEDFYVVFSVADIPGRQPYVVVSVAKGGNPRDVAGLLFSGKPDGATSREQARQTNHKGPQTFEVCEVLAGAVVAGKKRSVARIRQQLGRPQRPARPEFTAAWKAAGNTTAQLVIVPTPDNRRVIAEMLPQLPETLGGVSGRQIARGFRWAAIGADAPPEMALHLVIRSEDEESAKAVQRLIAGLLKLLATAPSVRKRVPKIDEVVKLLTPSVDGNQLTLSLTQENRGVSKLAGLAKPASAHALQGIRNRQSINNLKHFGLAMHNFHDAYTSFPPTASYDKNGKKLLSWRVYLLPYLDEQKLYRQFRLDEPWDSQHNRKLISKMPGVYHSPLAAFIPSEGKTTYLAPVGKPGKQFLTVFSGKVGVPMREITDGTSNTIMIIEVAPEYAVPWTKPQDLQVDFENPLSGIFGKETKLTRALFCDGSVHTLSKTIDLKKWRALFTRKGGEVVRDF